MYTHHLKNMVGHLLANSVIQKDQEQVALDTLQSYWDDKIAIVWAAEDITSYAEDLNKQVTHDEAIEILDSLQSHHDCQTGITWDHIEVEIDETIEARENHRVSAAKPEELPLLVNDLTYSSSKRILERRVKEAI